MLFSVVIPLYNKADTIERTIRSVWAQSFKDYELIVVNDGSIDASLNAVKRLSQETDFVIIDKKNGGVSSARNAGAGAASGQYIALLDGDDIWYPNHLELLANAIAKHPDVKFFGTGYERYSGTHVYYTIPWGGCRVKDVYSAFCFCQPINTSTVAIERDLWERIGGFDERYSFYEDYEFFFRLGLYTKCCIVRKISVAYRDDAAESITKKKRVIVKDTRPHLMFIENMVANRKITYEMLRYALTYIKMAWAFKVLLGSNVEYDALPNICPKLIKKSGNRGVSASIVNRVCATLMYYYYRIRNHLVIWRKFVG